MVKTIRIFLVYSILLSALLSCNSFYTIHSLNYNTYRVNNDKQTDSSVYKLIKPYGDSLSISMNEVVGIAERNLDKKSPESPLGNFVVDAYYNMALEKYNTHIDAAFMNYGGIRLTQLPAGEVTRGKIFELMPFDNIIVLQKVKGSVLQQFLDIAAAKGGWPVAGMTMQIKGSKAINVKVGGEPLNPEKIYTILNSDFIANGGDNADMLKVIPQITNGYLMRDAILDYIKKLKMQGKNINAGIENRVTHAE